MKLQIESYKICVGGPSLEVSSSQEELFKDEQGRIP